ncbi:acyltransferase domain-containing protein [Amycolatopsis keratiniphila]|uniref:acyltransferase domain-containing protein n=1 Tax=Amycolatopsis keratiniphila TaxID=129921 RepID=UPI00130E12D9|nr:acyltransferase domain-containing protein [Amycolatopsis keratiniphila]
MFETIDEVYRARTGRTVSSVVFAAEAPSLEEMLTRHPDELQLAIYGASVTAYRILAARGTILDLVVGHSFGEIAALVIGGAFSVADGASLVCDRNEVLRAHAPEGGLLALRCGRARSELLLSLAELPGLAFAVDNADEQSVLSGPAAQLATARTVAETLGIGTGAVSSPYGFHNHALVPAGRKLATKAAEYKAGGFAVPVYSPILGRRYHDGDDLATLLGLHLSQPVQFRETLSGLYAEGRRSFIELGAGETLTKLVRAAMPLASAVSALTQTGQTTPARSTRQEVAVPAPAAPPAQETVPAPALVAAGSIPARGKVFSQLRELYAEALEYPVEVLTEDAALEADLGVDSMRQTELLTKARQIFDLPAPAPGFRSTDLDTLAKVTDYVIGSRG